MCMSHGRHVTSHLKRRGDSHSRAHTHIPLSAELKRGSVRVWLLRVGSPWQNTTSANKSNRISSSQKALRGLPATYCSIVFASQNRARQNGSTQLSFCTVTAGCGLLDSIKTSQIHAHSCGAYLLQWKPYTAVLAQMYTESQ